MDNVGGIQYTVQANTGELLKAEQDTVRSVENMSKSLTKLGGSSSQVDKVSSSIKELGNEADKSGFKLNKIHTAILGMATLSTASSLAAMADEYREMGERVSMATESVEEFNIVQARLADSSNKAFRPLAEAQEIFIATSGNIREYGYSLEDALNITDSMSFGFVRNAASADKAQSAIRAFDASLSTGKVSAMQWLSISGAIDTLAKDMGESMGLTAREVDELGFSGQITAKMLNEALLDTFEANKDAAESMSKTIAGAFTVMRNNISTYVGELNKSTGATDLVANSILYLSNNISTLASLMAVAGAGAAAKYVTKMGMVTVAKMNDALATRASIVEEVRLAQINLASAQEEVKRTAALVAKGAGHAKNKIAIDAETVATVRLDAAQKAMAVTTRSFLALLGGPAGLVGLLFSGITAFAMFSSSANEAKEKTDNLKKSTSELIEEIEKMDKAQRDAAKFTYENERDEAIKETEKAYDSLISKIRDLLIVRDGSKERAQTMRELGITVNDVLAELTDLKSKGEDANTVITKLSEGFGVPEEAIRSLVIQNGELSRLIGISTDAINKVNTLSGAMSDLADETKKLTQAQREQAQINKEGASWLEESTKTLQNQASSLSDNGSALKKFNRELKESIDKGVEFTEEEKKQIETNRKLAEENDKLNESRKRSNKEIKTSSNVLKELQNELYLASLSGKELAIARAEQRLNEFASQQEIDAVRELAVALYDLNEAKKFGETKEEQDKYIEGDVGNLSGGFFDQQVERYMREAELEEEKYANQLEKLQEARELQLQTEEEFNDKEYDLKQKHDERMGRIAKATMQAQISVYSNAFGSIADIMKNAQGEQSGIYKAMFAASKGFAVANAGIKLYEAAMHAMADPTAITLTQKLANYGAVLAAGGSLMSAMQGISMGGGRQYGGNVSANTAYRINETGESEIFDAGGGKQYFIPNQHGKIIPANKVAGQSGGGSSNVTVNLIEDSSRGGTIEDQSTSEETILDVFVANIYSGGIASQAVEETYGLTRKGR